jgi:hypothetical protein
MHRFWSMLLFISLFSYVPVVCEAAETSSAPVTVETELAEKLVWSSAPDRPEWTISEPEEQGDKLYFVGLSGKMLTAQDAREDALRSGIISTVQYVRYVLETRIAQARMPKDVAIAGTVSDILNRDFSLPLAINLVGSVQPEKWYQERWRAPEGLYDMAYVLISVKKSVIEESLERGFSELAEQALLDSVMADEMPKSEYERVAAFWMLLAQKGLLSP